MPSLVWGRSPQEAYDNPYEYEAQDQFVREAKSLLKHMNTAFQKYSMRFHRDNRSIKKAVWMLQLDALDSLKDALDALVNKKHRVASKLFRGIVETLDLAAYFHMNSNENNRQLEKWYNDKTILHRLYRNFIKKTKGTKTAKEKADYYKTLSRITHRTYGVLLYGYGLGAGDMLWHDGYKNSELLILPQTISMYFAILADLILIFLREASVREILSEKEVKEAIVESLETKTVPRRFLLRLRK
jgi:hypothetical protein